MHAFSLLCQLTFLVLLLHVLISYPHGFEGISGSVAESFLQKDELGLACGSQGGQC